MAKKHYKTKSVSSLITRIVAIILMIAMIGGIVLTVLQFCTPAGRGIKPSEWFGSSTDQPKEPDDPNGDNEQSGNAVGGGMLLPSEVEGSGIRLMSAVIPTEEYSEYGIDAQAESAISVSVTIEPDDAEDKTITASLAFKNPSSEWASDKSVSDFVTATVSGLNISVACKAAFAEQIILTVGTSNPEVSATVTVDYAKRLIVNSSLYDFYNGATFKFSGTCSLPGGQVNQYSAWKWADYTIGTPIRNWGAFTINYTLNNYSIGTVENPVKSKELTVSFTKDMQSRLARNGGGDYVNNKSVYHGTSVYLGQMFDSNGMFAFCKKTVDGDFVMDTYMYNVLVRCFNDGYGDLVLTAKYEMTYGGSVTDTKEVDVLVKGISVTGVNTSQSGVVF